MRRCDRCHKDTMVTIMSFFNTDTICSACQEKERRHPMFKFARDMEAQAVKAGNYNFPGIGLPDDLGGCA